MSHLNTNKAYLSLYIISKYGGLIYRQVFNSKDEINVNEHLRLASTFHRFVKKNIKFFLLIIGKI